MSMGPALVSLNHIDNPDKKNHWIKQLPVWWISLAVYKGKVIYVHAKGGERAAC